MKSIVLSVRTNEEVSAIVDDEDYPILSRHTWYRAEGRYTTYAKRIIGGGGTELMHHLVIGRPEPGMVVDHINNDGLDNRKENLRFLPNAENIRRRYEDNPYAGITRKEELLTNPWKASISFGGKNIHVGYFSSKEEARRARDKKLALLLLKAEES